MKLSFSKYKGSVIIIQELGPEDGLMRPYFHISCGSDGFTTLL